ncbi:MAG: Holliday junction branch migration protein RuvA [Clostridia bacterium]|jgi:Holliday junction DNA helicase RuvA|nr:Holliday junction branch migration protein RuvA [Clostridia bacterium]
MIAYLKGNLEIKTKGYIVIEVAGIGYKVYMPESMIAKLGEIGEKVKIYTFMKVREDDVSLYGFITNEELRMFELLLSVSGIGAKGALTILSNVTPSGFALAVITNDVNVLKKLPGIGPKTAQRVILELKDKLKKEQEIILEETKENASLQEAIVDDEKIAEAVSALQVLGYSRKEIADALVNVDMKVLSVEDIIRKGLGNLAKSI